MPQRKVSNPLALAVMAWLLTGPMHPYELGKRLKETGKDRSIQYNRGSLYMVVGQLVKAGFVVEHETVRTSKRPERTVYALTDEGRGELYDWMREWVAAPQDEYPKFGVALSLLSILPPAEAIELLGRRRQEVDALMAEAKAAVRQATTQGVEWIFLIEEEYRLALLKGERAFLDRLVESLGTPGYARIWNAWKETFGWKVPNDRT
jgi:DNA-binding PadR family transcriptional regulator